MSWPYDAGDPHVPRNSGRVLRRVIRRNEYRLVMRNADAQHSSVAIRGSEFVRIAQRTVTARRTFRQQRSRDPPCCAVCKLFPPKYPRDSLPFDKLSSRVHRAVHGEITRRCHWRCNSFKMHSRNIRRIRSAQIMALSRHTHQSFGANLLL